MSNSEKTNICIVGAGIGGLTAGALFIKRGYNVKIFEKEEFIGGRSYNFNASKITLEQYKNLLSRFNMHIPFSEPDLNIIFNKGLLNGFNLDLGFHAIGGGAISNIRSALSGIENNIEMLESRVGFIKENSYDYPFLSGVDKLKILPDILHLVLASEKTMKKLDNVPISDTIKKYGKGKMKLILEVFSRAITTVNDLEQISTGEMFRSQKNLLKGSKPLGYPKGGLGVINTTLADFIKKNGGEIFLDSEVTNIDINNSKITGLKLKNQVFRCDYLVSNILVQNLFKIIDKKYFPKEYVENISKLSGTGSLCAYYSLSDVKDDLIGKTFFFIERNIGIKGSDAVGMIDFMSACQNSGLAPPSHYLVQAYIICTSDEAKNKEILQKLKILLDKNLHKLMPNYKTNLEWSLYPAIWHLDGVAKTIDNKKPDIFTPINNLFLVGDGVKAPGIGINCAVNSARILDEKISSNY